MTIGLDISDPVQSKLGALARQLHATFPKQIDLSLSRMNYLLEKMGNPHLRLPPVIHVAGTNGKGSTAAFMRAMLESARHKVHVYTSPHLVRFNERIRLAGNLIEDDYLLELVEDCWRHNAGQPITFFELTTIAAMRAFSERPADAAILEVGMGGRLDATNVVPKPALTVLTSISVDHQEFLGPTIEKIAFEKAAIQKTGVPSVVSPQSLDTRSIIGDFADKVGAKLFRCGSEWWAFKAGDHITYRSKDWNLSLPLPKLIGSHQVDNAATAIAAMEQLPQFAVKTDAIQRGLLTVEWPARLQHLKQGPLLTGLPSYSEIWLDGGHNPGAGIVLAETLKQWRDKPCYLIVGMLKTKDPIGFLEPLKGLVQAVYTVPIEGEEKTCPPPDLAEYARRAGHQNAEACDSVLAAAGKIKELEKGPMRILIAGSLYLAGRVLRDHE